MPITGRRYWCTTAALLLLGCGDPVGTPFTAENQPLLVVTNLNSVYRIYTLMSDGSDLRLVSGDLTLAHMPTWAPDRRRFAFVVDRRIYVANANGGDTTMLYHHPRLTISRIDWSPDGREILFNGWNPSETEIARLPLNGRPPRVIDPGLHLPLEATWSRTGNSIAFSASVNGSRELHVMSANGANVRQLTSGGHYFGGPQWSPIGDDILFVSKSIGPIEIWTIRASGGQPRRVTDATGTIDVSPAWSPDGTRIAFIRGRELYTAKPDGSDLRLIPAPDYLSHITW